MEGKAEYVCDWYEELERPKIYLSILIHIHNPVDLKGRITTSRTEASDELTCIMGRFDRQDADCEGEECEEKEEKEEQEEQEEQKQEEAGEESDLGVGLEISRLVRRGDGQEEVSSKRVERIRQRGREEGGGEDDEEEEEEEGEEMAHLHQPGVVSTDNRGISLNH